MDYVMLDSGIGEVTEIVKRVQGKFAVAGLTLSPGDCVALAIEFRRESANEATALRWAELQKPALGATIAAGVPADPILAGQDGAGAPGVEPARA